MRLLDKRFRGRIRVHIEPCEKGLKWLKRNYEELLEAIFRGRLRTHVEHHENGQKRVKGNYMDDRKDGLWSY